MSTQPTKNNLIMILEILKKHSDINHRLTQKDIQSYLKSDFDFACDRKTVKRNLMNLVEFGFDIKYSEICRGGEDGNVIITDIYYSHHFNDSEVKLISDSLLFSKYISAKETKRLIEKIEEQASPFAVNMLKNSVNFEALGHTENPQIFYTVELINQAVDEGRQVKFYYCEYDTDKKLHHKHDFKQSVNPYYTVTSGGRYYLIGNVDKFSNLANFCVDKIKDIEISDTSAKSIRKLEGCEQGFNLSDYMKEHLYMFSGETVHARIEVDRSVIGQIIDWYGKSFDVISDNGETCVISLTVNENALFYWAMQYGRFVKVISPQRVADRILETVEGICERYKEG
jgi:predicted DNA-binding transcriptional regulator YafY